MATMTYAQFRDLAANLRAREHRLTVAIVAEARNTARMAGLDPQIAFLHAHNAMCSQHYGNPWPEVNYSLCRRVLWLEQKSYEPGRIVSRILDRAFQKTLNH